MPALACFDDRAWSRILPRGLTRRAEAAKGGGGHLPANGRRDLGDRGRSSPCSAFSRW